MSSEVAELRLGLHHLHAWVSLGLVIPTLLPLVLVVGAVHP